MRRGSVDFLATTALCACRRIISSCAALPWNSDSSRIPAPFRCALSVNCQNVHAFQMREPLRESIGFGGRVVNFNPVLNTSRRQDNII